MWTLELQETGEDNAKKAKAVKAKKKAQVTNK